MVSCGAWHQEVAQMVNTEFEQRKKDGLGIYINLGSDLSSWHLAPKWIFKSGLSLLIYTEIYFAIKVLFLLSGIVYYWGCGRRGEALLRKGPPVQLPGKQMIESLWLLTVLGASSVFWAGHPVLGGCPQLITNKKEVKGPPHFPQCRTSPTSKHCSRALVGLERDFF